MKLVSGGMPVSHLAFSVIQLPPVHCKEDGFTELYDEYGRRVTPEWRARRRKILLDGCDSFAPDVLLLETFPFGRRQLHFELLPLLEHVKTVFPRTLVFSSVRDVVQKRRLERELETVSLVHRYFDGVLVHGDPGLLQFEESFSSTDQIRDKIAYTGYVGEKRTSYLASQGNGKDEIIVSAGGGAAGRTLYTTALAARSFSRYANARWRLLVGAGLPEAEFLQLKNMAAPGVVVERARADFTGLLTKCTVSVSQAGYNTVVDVLRTGARSVLVPYARGGETEQTTRARRLCERGYASLVDEVNLSPRVLARAVDRTAETTPSQDLIRLRGAETSARHVIRAMSKRQATI